MRRLTLILAAAARCASLALAAEERAHPIDPFPAETRLGHALELSPAELEAHAGDPRPARGWAPGNEGAITGLAVDTSKRDEVVSFFHCIYTPSEDFANHHGWTGDLAGCVPGTVSSRLHDDTLRRINFYRAMAGLNGDITFDSNKNSDCQEAALLMARNNTITHFPPSNWPCYTAAADSAAQASNLSLGLNLANYGPGAVNGQMEDSGGNNLAVGHRRWLLYSRAREMGHGSVPLTATNDVCAASIWVIGDFNPSPPAGLAKISWPPEGYVPHQIVWPRWSFGLPNSSAGFASATVTMSSNGTSIPLTIIHRGSAGVGDPTIVWEPSGPAYPDFPEAVPSGDLTFTVTISGITGATPTAFTYDVTVINPLDPGDFSLTGPARPPAHTASTYRFAPTEAAESYEAKISKIVSANWTEGAEDGTLGAIVDLTTPGLALRANDPKRTGAYAFHLAFDVLTEQSFEICRPIIPSATSQLEFYNLRRWATTTSVLYAEVSADGGVTWEEIWSRAGNGGTSSANWDQTYQSVSASLAAYAGGVLKLRFIYRHLGGSYFPGADSGTGFYLDDITVTNSQSLADERIVPLHGDSSSFTFSPDSANEDYLLQVRPILDCFDFDFSEFLAVTSSAALPGAINLLRVAHTGSQVQLDFAVSGGPFTTFTLRRSEDLAVWADDGNATLIDHGGGSYTFQTAPPAGQGHAFYLVEGD